LDNKSLYSSRTLFLFRLFALIAIIILVITDSYLLINTDLKTITQDKETFFSLLINTISILLLAIVVLEPSKIMVFSIISLLYSIINLIYEPENSMGIIMYFLCISSLYARGFFARKEKVKLIIALLIPITGCLASLRFGFKFFMDVFTTLIGFSFCLFMTIYFFQAYIMNSFDINTTRRLDLKDYPDLKKRDAEWLSEIIIGNKYEMIAIEAKMNLGSVKNRFKIIFDVLETGDKQGFLNKYSTYEICYGEEFSSFSKQKIIKG